MELQARGREGAEEEGNAVKPKNIDALVNFELVNWDDNHKNIQSFGTEKQIFELPPVYEYLCLKKFVLRKDLKQLAIDRCKEILKKAETPSTVEELMRIFNLKEEDLR